MLGGWMVSDHNNDYLTAMRTDCVAKPEWNGYLCPPTLENWVQVPLPLCVLRVRVRKRVCLCVWRGRQHGHPLWYRPP